MKKQTTLIVAFLLSASTAGAQQANELLKPVDPAQSQRLEEYNSVFLQEQLYFATRHRIVEVNTTLLLQSSDITVTPFDDEQPIRLSPLPGTPERYINDDHVFWRGRFVDSAVPDVVIPEGPPPSSVTIALHSWDLDPSGNAVISSQNRFEFSPSWTFDEAGNPVLDKAGAVIAGPPPSTPEQIARHKQLKALRKHNFYSADAVFDFPQTSRFVLTPLKYSPKYSVVFEIKRDAIVPIRIDTQPGDPEPSPSEKAALDRYQDFRNSLPKGSDKVIRGDVP